jgi:hypothetical protein
MHQKLTSYAIIETVSSREKPSRMFQCISTWPGGRRDEALTRKLIRERILLADQGSGNPRKRDLILLRCGR